MKLYGPLNLNRSELRNAITQNLGAAPAAPVAGLRYYDTGLNVERYHNGVTWVNLSDVIAASNVTGFDTQVRTSRLDQMAAPGAVVSFAGWRLTNLGTPIQPSDAATMGYVDAVAQGLDIKEAVRVASTEPVSLGIVTEIDGVTLAEGDRVLLKDQGDPEENGIYELVGASPTLIRAPDADSSAEVRAGMFCFVAEGTVNHDKGYVLTTDNPITVNVTELTFTQFSGAGSVVGTTDRITVNGNQVDIANTYTGQATITTVGTIATGVWHGSPVPVLYGGTGASTAATARTNLGATGKYTTTIGDGNALTYSVTHNLNSTAVAVELWETATGLTVYADVTRTSANAITIDGFTVAPDTDTISVVVIG